MLPGQRPAAVYRLFNRNGVLVYVGSAFDPWVRCLKHVRESEWWSEVDPSKTFIEWYPTKRLAEVAEATAIRLDHPLCNQRLALPRYDWNTRRRPATPNYGDRVPGRHLSEDRHRRDRPARLIRPDPPELWNQLGVMADNRGALISDLIARYLDGGPMPKRPKPPPDAH